MELFRRILAPLKLLSRAGVGTAFVKTICGNGDQITSGENGLACVVRLIDPIMRSPASSVELLVIALLRKEKEIPVLKLASRIADMFYRAELRAGAWAVDIGLFGRTLFIGDALRALEAGSGELWEIGKESRG